MKTKKYIIKCNPKTARAELRAAVTTYITNAEGAFQRVESAKNRIRVFMSNEVALFIGV